MSEEKALPSRALGASAPVLLLAATRWEAEPVARALGLAADGANRFAGRVRGRPVTLVKTGMGAIAARGVLDADFTAADFGLALSVGLCGALQEGVKRGELVADAQGTDVELVAALRETARASGASLHFGRLLHTNVVLQPAVKRRLGVEQRALACDMETAALRRWAQGSSLPVIGLRAVLDELDEALPVDAPRSERARDLARYAASHWTDLPVLLRAGWRSSRAMNALSRFLKTYLEAL